MIIPADHQAFEITPESLSSRDDVLEDYFKKVREPYSSYFLDGNWVATSVPPLPDLEH